MHEHEGISHPSATIIKWMVDSIFCGLQQASKNELLGYKGCRDYDDNGTLQTTLSARRDMMSNVTLSLMNCVTVACSESHETSSVWPNKNPIFLEMPSVDRPFEWHTCSSDIWLSSCLYKQIVTSYPTLVTRVFLGYRRWHRNLSHSQPLLSFWSLAVRIWFFFKIQIYCPSYPTIIHISTWSKLRSVSLLARASPMPFYPIDAFKDVTLSNSKDVVYICGDILVLCVVEMTRHKACLVRRPPVSWLWNNKVHVIVLLFHTWFHVWLP